jgi:ubiquitin-activating enzyme E1
MIKIKNMKTTKLNMSEMNDEDRYSRQSYSIGRESCRTLSKSKILIVGYDILGEEIIKNMALMGVGEIDIYCQSNVNESYEENLYFKINGNNEMPLNELKKLNPNTNIKIVNIKNDNNQLNVEIFHNYSIVILINPLTKDAILLNKITRACEVPLIITGTQGLTGYIFNDFGNEFEINDQDGEIYENLLIEEVVGNKIKFRSKHKLNDGNIIIIEYKNGYTEEKKILNVINPFTIQFNEMMPGELDCYVSMTRKKIKKNIKNISYEDFITNKKHDKIIMSDFSVPFERNELMFNLYLALNEYFNKFEELPRSWTEVDHVIFKNILNEINKTIITDENSNFIKKFCYTARGNFKPMASIIGGIASHEIIKGITKKFEPIEQGLFIDFIDDLVLDSEINSGVSPEMFQSDNKYQSIVNIFGKEFINKLQSIRPFIVGSGAIGCEILKNLCCLGIGNISITDNDSIEKSNLSRQLLFNDNDIGKSKSMCAGHAIMEKNTDCKVNIYESRVEKKTEKLFNDKFHSNIDIYLNALDNIDARKYMDSIAIKYEKPIIDSGTTGAQGNVGVIIPHLTESYQSSNNDADEDEIPLCTLKTFPFKPEHTIQWARELFEENFNVIPGLLNKYRIDNYAKLHNESQIELEKLYKTLYKFQNFKFDELSFLIQIKLIFNNNFVKNIEDVIKEYKNKPENTNKMPIFLNNANIEQRFTSFTFMMFNQMFNTNIKNNNNNLLNDINFNLDNYNVDNVSNINNIDKKQLINKIFVILEQFNSKQITEIDFEKDDDSLHHVDWITCCANARNIQYSIKQIDEYETKKIAGKIIPAMITTTSVISGFQIIEFIKIVKLYNNGKYITNEFKSDINIYKDKYINLNINYHIGNTPSPCKKLYYLDEPKQLESDNYLTLWSKFTSKSNKTKDILENINSQVKESLGVFLISPCNKTNTFIVDDEVIKIKETNSLYSVVVFNEYDMEFYVIVSDNINSESELIQKKTNNNNKMIEDEIFGMM